MFSQRSKAGTLEFTLPVQWLCLSYKYTGLFCYLDCDASLPFHLQLVQVLPLATRLDGTSHFHQPVCQCTFAMVYVGNDAEVADLQGQKADDSYSLLLLHRGKVLAQQE